LPRKRAQDLLQLLEGEIIPRLVVAHRQCPTGQTAATDTIGDVAPAAAETFARMAVHSGHDALMAFIGASMREGVSLPSIYGDLLAPAARLLGAYWQEDRLSFSDVTIALGRLQRVVHELTLHSAGHGGEAIGRGDQVHTALFLSAPGEQHTLGLSMVSDLFRRAGWVAQCDPSGDGRHANEMVSSQSFDVVGYTIACIEHLAPLRAAVMSIRRSTRNPHTLVMVGGQLLGERPDLARDVGADFSAASVQDALSVIDGMIGRLARR
jgi:methanogenic corrinoid protein MtbC1